MSRGPYRERAVANPAKQGQVGPVSKEDSPHRSPTREDSAMRRWLTVLTTVAMIVATTATGASAHAPYTPKPTVVQAVDGTATGTAVGVSATIEFGGETPVVLGEDPSNDAPGSSDAAKAMAMGVELTKIQAYRSGPSAPLTLEWHSATLDQLPPPEVVRFYWPFLIDGAGFSAQAKTTDFVSGANLGDGNPATVVDNLSQYQNAGVPGFRFRGNCATVVAVNNCGHIAWVTGEFDTEYNIIRVNLPLNHPKAPALKPGAVISPDTGAYSAYQAAADNAPTRDTVNQLEEYTIPESSATATLVDSAGTVVRTATLAPGEDGQWRGSLTAPAPGTYRVDVTACFATNCNTRSIEVVVS